MNTENTNEYRSMVAVKDDDKIVEIWDHFIKIKTSLKEVVLMLEEINLDSLSDVRAVQYHLMKAKDRYMTGNFELSFKSLNIASSIARNMKVEDKGIMGILYLHYGVMCYYRNDLNNAIHYYAISLDYLDNEFNRASIYNNIGDVYLELENYIKANEFLIKAREIQQQSPHLDDIGIIIRLNQGRCYSGMKDYKKAEELLNSVENLNELYALICEVYIARGENYWAWGKIELARDNYNEVLKVASKMNNKLFVAKGLLGLSRINLKKKEEAEFLKNSTSSLEMFQEIKVNQLAVKCVELIAEFYEQKKDYVKLHEINKLYIQQLKSKDKEMTSLSLLAMIEKQEGQLYSLERTDKLIKQQKSDLEDFTFATAHYLREPLRNISSYSQILKKNLLKLNEGNKEMFDFIIQNSKRADTLLLNLLSYLELVLHPDKKEIIDVRKVVDSVTYLLKCEYKDVDFTVEVGDLPKVFAEKEHISSLFKHLIENSIKFRSPNDQCIVKVDCIRNGGRDYFYIIDNGIGIKKDYTEKIFKLFYTMEKNNYEEIAGVGLAICKKIISFYNGDIRVNSLYKDGCKIDFTFS